MFTAIVRVTGAGRLAEFRERLRWHMVRDEDAEEYTEHHGDDMLEYRFEPRRGIPFPAIAAASLEFPELQVQAEWEHDGVRGRATIENGQLVQHPPQLTGDSELDIEVTADARLVLAFACNAHEDALVGYAANAERHTYFRFRGGVLELVAPEAPDAMLEEMAFAFVQEWLWYDEEEAVLERARYASYGHPVRGANLRSDKLRLLRAHGLHFSSLGADARRARDALVALWLKA